MLNSLALQRMLGNSGSLEPGSLERVSKHNMAGSEDGGPSDENSEWSDFSSNSCTINTLDDVPFGVRSQDPVSVINTLMTCFPLPSDFQSAALFDGAPGASERS